MIIDDMFSNPGIHLPDMTTSHFFFLFKLSIISHLKHQIKKYQERETVTL